MIIGIIGLGYVGLTLGVVAASRGIEVYGVEVNPLVKDSLRKNKAHFFEEGLDDLIAEYNNKTFHLVEKFPANIKFDAFIVTVGTPLLGKDVKKPNFDYIISALETIGNVYDGTQMLILRSTVSVGTTRNFVLPHLVEMCGLKKDEILLGMCPERTIEGKAIIELKTLPQIISGNNDKSLQIAKSLFEQISPEIIIAESFEEAELAKLYCNIYRDMTFAIGNAFCLAAQNYGVDGVKVIQCANQGYSRSKIAKPGFVAGPCLEKDAHILLNNLPASLSRDFIFYARSINESLEDLIFEYVKKVIGKPEENKIIAISGLAFKGRPETSDLRGSSSVYIAQKLSSYGYKLNLHDFVANREEIEKLHLGMVYASDELYKACHKTKLLLILNNHIKYEALKKEYFISAECGRILDVWDVCADLHNQKDIKVDTIGTINI